MDIIPKPRSDSPLSATPADLAADNVVERFSTYVYAGYLFSDINWIAGFYIWEDTVA